MELILRKFVYELFLPKFRGRVSGNGEITLVSRRHRTISLIIIVNNKINVTFEKNTNLKSYHTNIHVNTNNIIIEILMYITLKLKKLLIKEHTMKYLMVN